MERAVILLALACILSACENYQLGDITRTVMQARANYCTGSTPSERELALAVIHAYLPDYPAESVCDEAFITDMIQGLNRDH